METEMGIPNTKQPCVRSDGKSLRAYFSSMAQAEAFRDDPRNVAYHGDVAHLCGKRESWHLSKPEWLEPPLELRLTHMDAQLLSDMSIETPAKFADFKCSRCGAPIREGIDFFIMPTGLIVCSEMCGMELARL
jgi:hypothetical protein